MMPLLSPILLGYMISKVRHRVNIIALFEVEFCNLINKMLTCVKA